MRTPKRSKSLDDQGGGGGGDDINRVSLSLAEPNWEALGGKTYDTDQMIRGGPPLEFKSPDKRSANEYRAYRHELDWKLHDNPMDWVEDREKQLNTGSTPEQRRKEAITITHTMQVYNPVMSLLDNQRSVLKLYRLVWALTSSDLDTHFVMSMQTTLFKDLPKGQAICNQHKTPIAILDAYWQCRIKDTIRECSLLQSGLRIIKRRKNQSVLAFLIDVKLLVDTLDQRGQRVPTDELGLSLMDNARLAPAQLTVARTALGGDVATYAIVATRLAHLFKMDDYYEGADVTPAPPKGGNGMEGEVLSTFKALCIGNSMGNKLEHTVPVVPTARIHPAAEAPTDAETARKAKETIQNQHNRIEKLKLKLQGQGNWSQGEDGSKGKGKNGPKGGNKKGGGYEKATPVPFTITYQKDGKSLPKGQGYVEGKAVYTRMPDYCLHSGTWCKDGANCHRFVKHTIWTHRKAIASIKAKDTTPGCPFMHTKEEVDEMIPKRTEYRKQWKIDNPNKPTPWKEDS